MLPGNPYRVPWLLHLLIAICPLLISQPKYIHKLKKVAERRKLEQEIIYERVVQRDMEKEGGQSEGDTFLTSAYRKKLQERKMLEEELKMATCREGAYFISCSSNSQSAITCCSNSLSSLSFFLTRTFSVILNFSVHQNLV